ncbi:hypothetical protein [Streptococcus orisratti]|uniref:hypothetical protein n=1 Tax=Streptococcus orisratti TaxID=114652 RepID=UPI0023F98CDA|nr:hypothetical protein [Streptococcus orisratti]
MEITKSHFLMLDRVVQIKPDLKWKYAYHIYKFIKVPMYPELRHRKLNEFYTIQHMFRDTVISVVLYDDKRINNDLEAKLKVERFKTPNNDLNEIDSRVRGFADYQKAFCEENKAVYEISKRSERSKEPKKLKKGRRSKPLKKDDPDEYVTELLAELTNDRTFLGDDEGAKVTKNLLNDHSTYGIDIDLLDCDNKIVYEFLRRSSDNVNNLSAHPMRYCWNGKPSDNSSKFISLWRFCTRYNFKLVLVSYSSYEENDSNLVKIIFPNKIDENVGFLGDEEFAIKKSNLVEYLRNGSKEYLEENDIGRIVLNADESSDYWTLKDKLKDWADSITEAYKNIR